MLDVVIALLPALVASVIIFGFRALVLEVVCVVSCVVFEFLFQKITKRPVLIGDLSAVVTGLLLAYNLPVTFPVWMAVIGSFAAIVIAKQLFGGLGKNFANPAIVGRIVLFIAFAQQMTNFVNPVRTAAGIDLVSGATPLGKGGVMPGLLDMFLGLMGGCIGEVSTLALLIGGIYLIIRKVITPTIPVVYLAVVAVLSLCFGLNPLQQLMAGGVMLGSIFMATDYVTSPTTEKGKVIYAIGCGVLTMVIRTFGSYPEGVSFAILLMNIITPHIDNLTTKKAFGGDYSK